LLSTGYGSFISHQLTSDPSDLNLTAIGLMWILSKLMTCEPQVYER